MSSAYSNSLGDEPTGQEEEHETGKGFLCRVEIFSRYGQHWTCDSYGSIVDRLTFQTLVRREALAVLNIEHLGYTFRVGPPTENSGWEPSSLLVKAIGSDQSEMRFLLDSGHPGTCIPSLYRLCTENTTPLMSITVGARDEEERYHSLTLEGHLTPNRQCSVLPVWPDLLPKVSDEGLRTYSARILSRSVPNIPFVDLIYVRELINDAIGTSIGRNMDIGKYMHEIPLRLSLLTQMDETAVSRNRKKVTRCALQRLVWDFQQTCANLLLPIFQAKQLPYQPTVIRPSISPSRGKADWDWTETERSSLCFFNDHRAADVSRGVRP